MFPESQIQPIFAIPFCDELPFQQKGTNQISIQQIESQHNILLQQVMRSSFGWYTVIQTNEQGKHMPERVTEKAKMQIKSMG